MEPDGTGSRLLQGLFLKQVVPGDVVEPFFTAVMLQDPWPFDEFIRTQQEVNPHDGKLEHKGCNKAQRDGVAPHINGIADKTEPAVAARPENAGDESGVDAVSYTHLDVYKRQRLHYCACSGRGRSVLSECLQKKRTAQLLRCLGSFGNGGTAEAGGNYVSDSHGTAGTGGKG